MSDNPFSKGASDAAGRADDALGAEEAKLAAPTWAEVRKMLPEPADQEALDALIKAVNEATTHNEKVAALTRNIGKVGGVLVKILGGLR